jgi:hypothetical protein
LEFKFRFEFQQTKTMHRHAIYLFSENK